MAPHEIPAALMFSAFSLSWRCRSIMHLQRLRTAMAKSPAFATPIRSGAALGSISRLAADRKTVSPLICMNIFS